jgi:phosphate-selective porin OprO and OprP
MSKRRATWLATILAAAIGLPAPGWAQDGQVAGEFTWLGGVPAEVAGGESPPPSPPPAPDLAAEVAALKEAVRKLEDKAENERLKAAGKPTAELFGRTFVDTAIFSQDALNKSPAGVGEARNGFGFRAARVGVKGSAFNVVEYSSEVDFVSPINDNDGARPIIGDGVAFRDMWMAVNELPLLGTIKVGHFREHFSLDQVTSSRNMSFMERSMSDSLFVPGFRFGVGVCDNSADERMTWSAGLFQTDLGASPPVRNFDDLACQFTARFTCLPWYDEATEGRGLLHVGVGYYYADAFHDTKTFAAKSNSAFGPIIVSTGELAVDDWQCLNLELAWVYGSWSVQSECFGALVDPKAAGQSDGWIGGCYVMTSFFLTGEHRPYNRKTGVFDRVRPLDNFFRVRTDDGSTTTGSGAWETLYRFDYADVYDAPTSDSNILGRASTHTLGVNWYLTPYARVMWNYIHADPTRNHMDAGNLDAFTMRCQIDF